MRDEREKERERDWKGSQVVPEVVETRSDTGSEEGMGGDSERRGGDWVTAWGGLGSCIGWFLSDGQGRGPMAKEVEGFLKGLESWFFYPAKCLTLSM